MPFETMMLRLPGRRFKKRPPRFGDAAHQMKFAAHGLFSVIRLRPPSDRNGHSDRNGPPDPPPAGDLPDPLAEAEALRAALAEATARAGRLVAALKHQRKEKKALTQVWAGLKQLNLGPGGQP